MTPREVAADSSVPSLQVTLRPEGRPLADAADVVRFDKQHVWHPYSSIPGPDALLVESASGVHLSTVHPRLGRLDLVDGMSSWWAAIHGYAHPALDAAIASQIARMSHVMFGGLTHRPAVELAQRLIRILAAITKPLPGGLAVACILSCAAFAAISGSIATLDSITEDDIPAIRVTVTMAFAATISYDSPIKSFTSLQGNTSNRSHDTHL